MSSYLTPLEVCERLVGSRTALAAICGLGKKGAFFWNRPSQWRDAGDMLPKHQRSLLDYSDRHGLGLTAGHLIRGADEAEIVAILDARGAAGPGTPAVAQVAA